MKLQTLKYAKRDGIATTILNRPEKRNPLSLQVFKELSDCLDDADEDKKIGALIITGGDEVFWPVWILLRWCNSNPKKPLISGISVKYYLRENL